MRFMPHILTLYGFNNLTLCLQIGSFVWKHNNTYYILNQYPKSSINVCNKTNPILPNKFYRTIKKKEKKKPPTSWKCSYFHIRRYLDPSNKQLLYKAILESMETRILRRLSSKEFLDGLGENSYLNLLQQDIFFPHKSPEMLTMNVPLSSDLCLRKYFLSILYVLPRCFTGSCLHHGSAMVYSSIMLIIGMSDD